MVLEKEIEGLSKQASSCEKDAEQAFEKWAHKQRKSLFPLDHAGFDDIETARDFHPPLTTVHQQLYVSGHEVATSLLRMIEDEEFPRPWITLRPVLVT